VRYVYIVDRNARNQRVPLSLSLLITLFALKIQKHAAARGELASAFRCQSVEICCESDENITHLGVLRLCTLLLFSVESRF